MLCGAYFTSFYKTIETFLEEETRHEEHGAQDEDASVSAVPLPASTNPLLEDSTP